MSNGEPTPNGEIIHYLKAIEQKLEELQNLNPPLSRRGGRP